MSDENFNKSDYQFIGKTVQAGAIRSLIEALKEILTDVNIECDSTGMRIVAMDVAHIALVHMKLDAKNFEEYYCPQPITNGVSMIRLYKILKILAPGDTLTFYREIDKGDASNASNELRIIIDSNKKYKFKLKLMDFVTDKVSIPPITFPSHLRMPSNEFQKLCRDMSQLADKVEIISSGNELRFLIENQWVEQETIISEDKNDSGLSYISNMNPDEVIQGVFSLKYLVIFSKCTGMCPNIEIYLKNGKPLIIRYAVANLGEVKFCLAPLSAN